MGSDDEPGAGTALVDFSVNVGESGGYATIVLQILGNELVMIRRSESDADPELRYRGEAADVFVERVRRLASGLAPADLAPVYGKPDSRDEGAATVRVVHDTVVSAHAYSASSAPPELEALHRELMALLDGWFECAPPEGVTFHDCP